MIGLIGICGILTIMSFQIACGVNKLEKRLNSIEQRIKEMEDEE